MNDNYDLIRAELAAAQVTLVAVSKTKPVHMIQELYDAGQRDFGENKVQELMEKMPQLPSDIRWHLIGHLQKNKVKYIASFVHLIHSVDSLELLAEINKHGAKNNRIIPCLLQIYIAREDTKFGLDEDELFQLLHSQEFKSMKNVEIRGLMGMATMTENQEQIRSEFRKLKRMFDQIREQGLVQNANFTVLSMGMSSDYHLAIDEGSNMVRIGSLLFGSRNTDI